MNAAAIPADPPHQQRTSALEHAKHVRRVRAEIKQQLARQPMSAGLTTASTLLFSPPSELEGMKVATLLTACRFYGPTKARRLLRQLHIPEARRLGDLTLPEQCRLRARLLEEASR